MLWECKCLKIEKLRKVRSIQNMRNEDPPKGEKAHKIN